MMDSKSWADRREFGRRPVTAPASAVLPGQLEVQCNIENISDGGALLHFPGGLAPTQSFHLSVEGTGRSLLCEIRHRNGARLGVRFMSLAEGIALNRELQPQASLPPASQAPVRRAADAKPMERLSVREMRRAVLGISEVPAEVPAEVAAAAEAAEPALPAEAAAEAIAELPEGEVARIDADTAKVAPEPVVEAEALQAA